MPDLSQMTSQIPAALIGGGAPTPTSPANGTPQPCPGCGTTPCLAAVRAETPPTGWIDLLDRTIARLLSCRWTIKRCGCVVALVAGLAVIGAVLGLVLMNKIPGVIQYAVHMPWGWAYILGVGALTAGGVVSRRLRARTHSGRSRGRQRTSSVR